MSAAGTVGRLLVDARPIDHPTARDRGIGRYTAGLLDGLGRIGAPVTALYATDREAERVRSVAPGIDLRRWSPAAVRDHAGPTTWYLATQLMLHPPSLDPIPAAITAARLPVAAVMYDVIPLRHPDRYLRDPAARALVGLRVPLARTVDAMLAISEFSLQTAAEALAYPTERMRTIGAGVDRRFVPMADGEQPWPSRFGALADRRFVVAVTGSDERKNTEGLLRAWARLDPSFRAATALVVATAADGPVRRRWQQIVDDAGIGASVVFTGFVTDAEMVALLQRAHLAVLPSFDEGFGLPVLEAAACGTPAICSDGSSLREVLDDPVARFDPADVGSIADAIERAVDDETHRERLAATGRRAVERYTWPRTATDALAALAELGPRGPLRTRRPARRIALVGSAGAGDASSLEALAETIRAAPPRPVVDALVDSAAFVPATVPAGGGRAPVSALGRYLKPWDYDDVVLRVGGAGVPAGASAGRLAREMPHHLWIDGPLQAAPPAPGPTVRSVVVADAVSATAVRDLAPDGPPIAVVPPADGPDLGSDAGPGDQGSAGWSGADRAAALVAWLDALDGLPGDTIRRFPDRP